MGLPATYLAGDLMSNCCAAEIVRSDIARVGGCIVVPLHLKNSHGVARSSHKKPTMLMMSTAAANRNTSASVMLQLASDAAAWRDERGEV